jgi:hypothetical protein
MSTRIVGESLAVRPHRHSNSAMRASAIDRNIADPAMVRYLVALVLLACAKSHPVSAAPDEVGKPAVPTSAPRRRRDIRPPRAC